MPGAPGGAVILFPAALAAAAMTAVLPPAVPSVQVPPGTAVLCQPRSWKYVDGGRYVLYDDVFAGSGATVCIRNRGDAANYAITTDTGPYGWDAYPDLFEGCQYTVCSQHSALPAQVAALTSAVLTLRTGFPHGFGSDATDFWLWKTSPGDSPGHPDGAEIMLWLAWRGEPPYGGSVVTIDGARWYAEHWLARADGTAWTYIQIRRLAGGPPSVTGLNLLPVFRFCETQGWISASWWVSSLDAGDEVVTGDDGDADLDYSLPVAVSATARRLPDSAGLVPAVSATARAAPPRPRGQSGTTAPPALTHH